METIKSENYYRRLDNLKCGRFDWGQIIKIHEIGIYIIVEYYEHISSNEYEKQSSFFPYIDGENRINASYESLDHALIACVCKNNDNHNVAADLIMKMIKT